MPRADLPTTWRGWVVAIVASLVGFIAGFAATSMLGKALS